MHAHEQTRKQALSHNAVALLAVIGAVVILAVPVAAAGLASTDTPTAAVSAKATTRVKAKAKAFVPARVSKNPAPRDDFPPRTSSTLPPTTLPPTTLPPVTAPPVTAPPVTAPPTTQAPVRSPSVSSGGIWDALARCESGGNWSINSGNGFYGGLQFTLSSWHAVGGSGYPNQNSRETQIAMGQRLQASQGWGAWPVCSRKIGMR